MNKGNSYARAIVDFKAGDLPDRNRRYKPNRKVRMLASSIRRSQMVPVAGSMLPPIPSTEPNPLPLELLEDEELLELEELELELPPEPGLEGGV